MHSIILLTRLQILQAIGSARAAIEKRTGANGAMAGTALIALVLVGGLGWLGYAVYGLVGQLGLDKTIYDSLFVACGTLTFTFSLPSVLGSFFGSSDINDLLPLPVTPFSIVLSKALGALSTSYLWTLLFIAGPLAGWGIASGAGVGYWVTYVLAVIFTPFMPTAYAGTLSILIATVFKRVRRKDAITTIATTLTLGISLGFYFISNRVHLSEGVANVLGGMSESMGGVVMAFPAYGFAVYALAHTDPLGTVMFVLLSLVAFVVFVFVARVLYMRIVTSLSSGAGKAQAYDGTAAQEQTPVFKALVLTEIHKVLRNSSVLLNYVAYPLLISPALFAIMFMTGSAQTLLGGLAEADPTGSAVIGFVLITLMFFAVISGVSNKIAGTGVSREGSNWIHMKFIPVPIRTQIMAKILPGFIENVIISVVFMVGGSILLLSSMSVNPIIVVSGLALLIGAMWLMACVAAWSESRNPNVDWGNDGDVNVKSLGGGGGTLRATLVGLAYCALPLLVTPLVNLDPVIFMPVLAVAGVAVAVLLGRVLLSRAARNLESFE